jgi:hypothetical protein
VNSNGRGQTADNNGMNAEPLVARFQMEHQPRRPGYAKRSPARLLAADDQPLWFVLIE